MPELPEVETVRRGLSAAVVGATISAVEVRHPRSVRRQPGGADELSARVTGRRISGTGRRGKYLWLELDDVDEVLVTHLGMSGQLRVVDRIEPDSHARVDLLLDDGRTLRFRDQRTFGWVVADESVAVDGVRVPAVAAHIAPDPFEHVFDESVVRDRFSRSRSGVKRLLLDQRVISGIGNIYADESLWRAQIHFDTPASLLSSEESGRLIGAARDVMAAALAAGGTSFDALYVDISGDSGWFERSLAVYGREDEPCSRCGTPVCRVRFANRSSFLCPQCQPPRPGGTRLTSLLHPTDR